MVNEQRPQLPIIDVDARMRTLVASAEAPKMSGVVPIERYYKSMLEMHRMAMSYLNERNLEKGLILLIRFTSFVLEEMPKHPAYSTFDNENKRKVMELLSPAFAKAKSVKEELKLFYQQDALRITRLIEAHRVEQERMEELRKEAEVRQAEEDAAKAQSMQEQMEASRISDVIVNPGVNTAGISYDGLNAGAVHTDCSHPVSPSHVFPSLQQSNSQIDEETNKSMVVAGDLVERFLDCARENTDKNVETCAILCGKNMPDCFLISHILLPKQSGTSDGCFAEGEAEVFEVQRLHDLLTFGWIHSHPSQTAFLSSVDLHTHHAYQSAMNQAIAIVCAPKHNQIGTYVLTPEGMQTMSSCQLKGFHPHPEAIGNLYREAEHVTFAHSHKTVVIDLRSK